MCLLYRLSLGAPIWPIEVGGPRVLPVWAHSSYATEYYPFTTLISGCDELFKWKILDKASRTQQELLAELTATQWQHAVFVADFDARDREANSIVFDYFVHARP
jgi:hypothetical protein